MRPPLPSPANNVPASAASSFRAAVSWAPRGVTNCSHGGFLYRAVELGLHVLVNFITSRHLLAYIFVRPAMLAFQSRDKN